MMFKLFKKRKNTDEFKSAFCRNMEIEYLKKKIKRNKKVKNYTEVTSNGTFIFHWDRWAKDNPEAVKMIKEDIDRFWEEYQRRDK